MVKEFTANELKYLIETLFQNWEEFRKDLRLNGKSTYNLIAIKKEFERQAQILQETIFAIGTELGGHPDDHGNFKVPNDKVEEMNNRLIEFGNQKIEISYNPIVIKDSDFMSPGLMDLMFPFIEYDEH